MYGGIFMIRIVCTQSFRTNIEESSFTEEVEAEFPSMMKPMFTIVFYFDNLLFSNPVKKSTYTGHLNTGFNLKQKMA